MTILILLVLLALFINRNVSRYFNVSGHARKNIITENASPLNFIINILIQRLLLVSRTVDVEWNGMEVVH